MTEATFQLDPPDSVIITLEPSEADRDALLVPDGVSEDDFHLTLVRVGDIGEMPKMAEILGVMLDVAGQSSPLVGEVSGIGFFGSEGFAGNTVALVDVDAIAQFRTMLADALAAAKMPVDETYDFIPHITLAEGPVAQPETKVGRTLLFQRLGLRFGPQVVLIPFGQPMVTATGEEVEIDEPTVEEIVEPVPPVVEIAGPNAEQVAALLERFVGEFGRFIQGPDGRLMGSERDSGDDDSGGGDDEGGGSTGGDDETGGGGSNPFTPGDRMADVLPASGDEFVDQAEADAVAEIVATGGDIVNATGAADLTAEDMDNIEQTNNTVEEAMQPAPPGVEVYTMAFVNDQYTLDPETGEVSRPGTRQTDEQSLQAAGGNIEGTPQFIVGSGDPASALKFAGEGEYVYGRGDGSIGRQEGQRVPVKVTVPEGHPMVNAGRDNDVNPDGDTNVVLSRDTGLTITGFGIDAATGAPMFTAEAKVMDNSAF